MPRIGEKVRVKPAPDLVSIGARVLLAPGRFLSEDGAEVEWSAFLDARLASGEIVIVPQPAPTPAPAPSRKSKE